MQNRARECTSNALAARDSSHPGALQTAYAFEPSPPRFLDGLSEAERKLVALESRLIKLRRGELLFRQGTLHNGIFVIRSGRMRTFFVSPAGRELTLAYWAPHHFVGAPEVFGNGRHQWSGMAVVDSEVLHLEANRLKAMAAEMPGLAIALIDGLVFKCRRFSRLVQMLATQSASARLASVLLELSADHVASGSAKPGKDRGISQKLSHDQLASLIGVTRQWVTTMISLWCDEQILRREGRRIIIADVERLAAHCAP